MSDAETSSAGEAVTVDAVGDLARRVTENVERVVVGNRETVEHLLCVVLGRGHVLLEDVPGVGKTMLARSLARSFDCTFTRVQFTPDLLPSDITGVNVFNQKTREFEFREGPVFGNVVLGDEINRAPPKTQSALLEAMEEQQVTVDGETHPLPDPFAVIATQNSVERDRTYELPAAELDRFTAKLTLGYPDAAEESEMLGRIVGDHPIDDLEPVAGVPDLVAARRTTAGVTVSEAVRDYVTRLARYTRDTASLGVSPRGSLWLLRVAQGRAVLEGRDYVIPDDVQREAAVTLEHRIRTAAGDRTPREVVEAAVADVDAE